MKISNKQKRVTLAQIAERSAVSSSAVSAFLNGRDYGIRIGTTTKTRIMQACRELNYRPKDRSILGKLYPNLGDVCFLLNTSLPGGTQHQYFGKMLEGVIKSLGDTTASISYGLFDLETDYLAHPERLPQAIRSGAASRFIAASSPNQSLVQALLNSECPFVYLGHAIDTPGLTCIVPDYAKAAQQAVHYLAKLGHQRIAYLTGPFGANLYNMNEMERGFVEGIRKEGLRLSPEYIYHCESEHGEFPMASIHAATEHLISLNPAPTAILCFHDPAAIAVSAYIQARGYSVPTDFSVMGFNDEPSAATHYPALTTVHFPLTEMGQRAITEIENQISCDTSRTAQLIKLPTYVVERSSCAPPSKETKPLTPRGK